MEEVEFTNIHERTSKKNQNALHLAVAANDLGCIELLIEAGSEIDEKDADGDTPLKTAIDLILKEESEDSPSFPVCKAFNLLRKNGAKLKNKEFESKKKDEERIFKKCVGGKKTKDETYYFISHITIHDLKNNYKFTMTFIHRHSQATA